MVAPAHAALIGLALLLGGSATRRVKRQDRASTDRANDTTSLAYPNTKECWLVASKGRKFQRKGNYALRRILSGYDPLNISLHAGKYEIDFHGCTIGMEVDASVLVGGFGGAQIESFGCTQDGRRTITLGSRTSFGRSIETAGAIRVNWTICGVNYPNETAIRVGAFTTNPGINVALKLYKYWGLVWKPSGFETLEFVHGGIDRITCDLTGLPEFIGKPVSQWCENIIQWLIDKIVGNVKDRVNTILQGVDTMAEECDPEYDCDCDGNTDCGKWDYDGNKCHNLDQCDFNWRLGDKSQEQKCRCKQSQ